MRYGGGDGDIELPTCSAKTVFILLGWALFGLLIFSVYKVFTAGDALEAVQWGFLALILLFLFFSGRSRR